MLGTTALAAAGLIAAPAMADDMAGPVTVGVGGYTTGAIGFCSDGGDTNDAGVGGKRGHDISYVYEIGVSGELLAKLHGAARFSRVAGVKT